MKLEKFSASEIPYQQFEALGYSKQNVLDIKRDVLDNFLSGGKTNLRMFSIPVDGQTFKIEGKLSLQRNPDGSVSLNLHPAQKGVSNNLGLNNKELEALKNGELISKTVDGERCLLQLDRETNEILTAKTKGLSIPFDLKSTERERLLNGKSLELEIEGKTRNFRLDLIDPNGFRLDKTETLSRYVGSDFLSTEIKDSDISKYRLNENDINNLLDGKRTELKEIDDNSAKFSLQRNPDGSVSLNLHPAQKEIQNNLRLDNKELEALKNGELISKTVDGERCLLQLDRETNEILKQKETNVIPSAIRDIELSSDLQERLRQGSSVTLLNENGENITAKVDLGSNTGLQIKDDRNKLHHIYRNNLSDSKEIEKLFSNKSDMNKFMERNNISSKNIPGSSRTAFDKHQSIAFDRHNPGVVSHIKTDANRAEYMTLEQKNTPSLKR